MYLTWFVASHVESITRYHLYEPMSRVNVVMISVFVAYTRLHSFLLYY